MGTRWRGLLALENEPTDDRRRFKELDVRLLPLGQSWQREDQEGHLTAVIVSTLDAVNWGTVGEAVDNGWISPEQAAASGMDPGEIGIWGGGEMLDDVDPKRMPRLAEDVAEAMVLLSKRVIAPSIDPIPQGAVWMVEPGSDVPVTDDRFWELMEQSIAEGDLAGPHLETLFERGLIAAATWVRTPAFNEVRPFEFVAVGEEGTDDGPVPDTAAAATQRALALTAAAPPSPPADLFDDPGFDRYTEIHVTERPDGLLQVKGHYAPTGSCHLAFRDACVSPPLSQAGYVPFHRHVIQTAAGELLGVGRITTGFGKVGTGCKGHTHCRGKDDHACEQMSMAQAIAHHDQQTPLAWVRAGEDEHGLYVVGVADADLTAEGRKLLEGRKFSGDWREHGTALELVELLALANGTPAFPAPRTYMRGGRQASLVAAYPAPNAAPGQRHTSARTMARMVVEELRAAGLVVPQSPESAAIDRVEQAAVTAATVEHTGAMIALVPSPADAERLAVEGGEPVDQLHLTLAYLGEADAIDADTRTAITEAVWTAAEAWGGTLTADGFSLSVFNPGDSNDRDTCVVVGVSGDTIETAHTDIATALDGVFEAPEQHQPFAAHVTLAYTDDLSMVEELAESRVGEITFDRLRIAFAGEHTDIMLGTQPEPDAAAQAAALLAEFEAALAAPAAHERAREAQALVKELEAVSI